MFDLAQQGKIVTLRKDIGRHNNIDMLNGYTLLQKINFANAHVLGTERTSSEIVYKVCNLSILAIISRSAPTTKAIDLLQKADIMLIGYVRRQDEY